MTPGAETQPRCRPMTLFCFVLGGAFLQLSPVLPTWPWLVFALSAGGLLFWRRPRWAPTAACLAGFAWVAMAAAHALAQRLPMALSGQAGEATVQVAGLPERIGADWHFEAEVKSSGDFPMLQGGIIKLAWYRMNRRIEPGDVLRVQVKLRVPNGVQNPGGFDAEKRALEKRWLAQGYVKHGIARLDNAASIDGLRNRVSSAMAASLGERRARFVQSLAIGDTRQLDDADWRVLRRTGIVHLIAISGFHVGIVALAAAWCMFFLYWLAPACGHVLARPRAMALAAMLAAWAYALLAGFAVATLRTALMISVFMLCRLCLRRVSVLQSVALAMAAVLCIDPFATLSAGFWLSFAGVLLLLALMAAGSGGSVLKDFLRAQWLCGIGLLPLTIAFFGQSTLAGPLANAVAIPWISFAVVPLALLGSLFWAWPAVSGPIWALSALLMDWLYKALQWAADTPWAALYFPEPGITAVLAAMLGAVLMLLPGAVRGKWLGLLLLLPLLWPKTAAIGHGQFGVAMIDVGQGTSVLVRTRHHALLYDTGAGKPGGFSMGESVVVPALRAVGVRQLDVVVVSHGDSDHAGGLPAVREAFPGAVLHASEGALAGRYRHCLAGDTWQWDGVRFQYLWPDTSPAANDNDRSCVLQVSRGRHRLLLTGDIGAAAEAVLADTYGDRLRSDVLLVPHHGSRSSSSETFIRQVRPEIALVSSGFQNRFRHPNPDVADRYRVQGALLVNTVDSGWAELQVSDGGLRWLHRQRLDGRRYWHRPVTEAAVPAD